MDVAKPNRMIVAVGLLGVFFVCWSIQAFIWGVLLGSTPAALASSIAPYFGIHFLIAGDYLLGVVSLLFGLLLPVLFVSAVIKPDFFALPGLCALAILAYFAWGFLLISIGV